MNRFHRTIIGAALCAGIYSPACMGQMAPSSQFPSQQPQPIRPGLPPLGPEEPLPPQIQAQQAKARNNDRQKHLVEDTDKLLLLATQLKQDVDKTNKDVLSIDVIKKADEIEKLAHSIKDRMKG
ncbi:MAG TPA: hypothetical protein VFE38_09565 [Edaphobacter sp.]|nr:hypothetical protein [Edaphobacter sp.]